MKPTAHYKWSPIADLDGDGRNLTDGELNALHLVWQDHKNDLSERAALEKFALRLKREWAIETGIIEDVYTLDRGVTRTLIEKGIDAALIPHDATNKDTTLVARVIQDHYDALDGMFDFVKGSRALSTSYVKELHAALLRNMDTHTVGDQCGNIFEKRIEKGKYKSAPNSPARPDGSIHEYSPPEQTSSEMDELMRMHGEHSARGVPVEVEAAWLHHRFTQIHPFADGNGRVARAVASLVFIKADWFPLVIRRDGRVICIEALEAADAGDLRPFVSIFVEAQRSALIGASEIAYDVRPITTTHGAIGAIRERLQQQGRLPMKEWKVATDTAGQLWTFTLKELEEVAATLRNETVALGPGFVFAATCDGHASIDEGIRGAGQIPDFRKFRAVAQVQLNAGRPDSLIFSFHALGPRYRGIMGVAAYLFIEGTGPNRIEGGTFQTNYREDPETTFARFGPWLDRITTQGLNQWRLTL